MYIPQCQEGLTVAGPIRFTGMASGLPPNIVDQIMDAERIPVKNMESKKAKEEDTLKLVNDLEGKIGEIQKNIGELVGTRGFTDSKLTSTDPSIVDGTIDPTNAVTGEYMVEVDQLAFKPGAVTNGFPDKNETQIGVGYIKFKTPNGTKEVYINGKNSTLEGVANQINASGTGLKAHIIDDRKDPENPYKLMITGLQTGGDNNVEFPTVYMLDGDQDFYFEESRKGQNAKFKIDGFQFESDDNYIEGIIPGVTLDLKNAVPDRNVRINVKENLEVISGKIKAFVDAYNGALGFIQNQNKLTKGQNGKESLGPLGGQSILRSLEGSLRRIIQNPQYGTGSSIQIPLELGIEFTRNGTLQFNQQKFEKVLNTNPKEVAQFFRGDGFKTGFATAVKREIGEMLNGQFGALANRKKGIQQKIDATNKRIEMKERQLETKEESLRRKFSDLEAKMSKLNSQGAQVGAMAGSFAGGGAQKG
jgi:flagellar hook-associated protein 2